jgi:hypothetical protein
VAYGRVKLTYFDASLKTVTISVNNINLPESVMEARHVELEHVHVYLF